MRGAAVAEEKSGAGGFYVRDRVESAPGRREPDQPRMPTERNPDGLRGAARSGSDGGEYSLILG